MNRPSHTHRNRIALECCLGACIAIVAAGTVSAFWCVTYAQQSWGVLLEGGDVAAIHMDSVPGYGLPLATGLTVEARHWGIEFGLPGFQAAGNGYHYYFGIIPLWLPLLVFTWLSVRLWHRGLQVPPGYCPCGYSLQGNTSGVCPECGTETRNEVRIQEAMPRARILESNQKSDPTICESS